MSDIVQQSPNPCVLPLSTKQCVPKHHRATSQQIRFPHQQQPHFQHVNSRWVLKAWHSGTESSCLSGAYLYSIVRCKATTAPGSEWMGRWQQEQGETKLARWPWSQWSLMSMREAQCHKLHPMSPVRRTHSHMYICLYCTYICISIYIYIYYMRVCVYTYTHTHIYI